MSRYSIDPDFEPRVADWLEADPDLAPAPVLSTVLAAFPSIPQRRASRVPWRFKSMSTFAKLAIAAVILIAVGSVGIIALQPSGGRIVGSAPSPAPSPTLAATPTPVSIPDGCAVGAAAERDVHVAHERNLDRVTPLGGARNLPHGHSRWTAGPRSTRRPATSCTTTR